MTKNSNVISQKQDKSFPWEMLQCWHKKRWIFVTIFIIKNQQQQLTEIRNRKQFFFAIFKKEQLCFREF